MNATTILFVIIIVVFSHECVVVPIHSLNLEQFWNRKEIPFGNENYNNSLFCIDCSQAGSK